MREFILINGNGNTYSLMSKEHWLYEPDNLGAKFSSKYEQIGADFVRTQRVSKPDDIKGTILFTKNPYTEYNNLIKFLAVEPLTLVYRSAGEFRVNVDLKEIEKDKLSDFIDAKEYKG